ncbi:MAG: DUF2336 domain-containing protein [Rhodospirillaceae bacterium]|nr:DUF2336 domain-containing protein [Rhodospirillales bacterium]MBT3905011.1 DUF2336 domain-containing protein [Rhodospirillaceae bacterium]MBT4702712.1 DUF2336 domain-containing protein [Rhodospirillaceae bacterium]MBT5034666.1 DUF2336 domain-containing protein [Rhodospirillaceae bacterium]MBT6218272.1 DUF2336 domain-containing protein [Rhodospirillaceae bacterium]
MNSASKNEPITYEQARELARASDPKVRADLARRSDIKSEILYFLADDTSPDVRRAIAENEATPDQANELLVTDADEGVRTCLAAKIARLAPNLNADEQNQIRQTTHDLLRDLAQDQIAHVRMVLSEALKDVANAPPDVIKRLAMDPEIDVAGPVLEFSPVLTDDDLLEIIHIGPAAGGLGSISRRQAVGESVTDAIVATNDEEAIVQLIGNASAQIREETLDRLIEQAENVELWHAPLVARPKLSATAAGRLAQFVANDLLEQLQSRSDFDEDTLSAVTRVVHHRLGEVEHPQGAATTPVEDINLASFKFLEGEIPENLANRLHQSGKLDYKVVANALRAGDGQFVIAALTARSGIPMEVARKIFAEQSAKGIIALCWKAELPMKLALALQQKMARIPPGDIIGSTDSDNFPLNDDALSWQLEFFSNLSDNGSKRVAK